MGGPANGRSVMHGFEPATASFISECACLPLILIRGRASPTRIYTWSVSWNRSHGRCVRRGPNESPGSARVRIERLCVRLPYKRSWETVWLFIRTNDGPEYSAEATSEDRPPPLQPQHRNTATPQPHRNRTATAPQPHRSLMPPQPRSDGFAGTHSANPSELPRARRSRARRPLVVVYKGGGRRSGRVQSPTTGSAVGRWATPPRDWWTDTFICGR